MTSRISFISHAETPAVRRAAFPLDEMLERRVIDTIESIAWKAPKAQQVLSGPEQRARMTASSLHLAAVVTDDLRDCDFGSWQGRELDQVQADDAPGLQSWLTDPLAAPHGGESLAAVVDRVLLWLDCQSSITGHLIAVTHPAIIRSAILVTLGAPLHAFWRIDIAPLSLTDLRYNGSRWSLRSAGVRLDQAP